MTQACPFCTTGTVRAHDNGQKKWMACECGQHRTNGIDLSDFNVNKAAQDQWDDYVKSGKDAVKDESPPADDAPPPFGDFDADQDQSPDAGPDDIQDTAPPDLTA